MPSVKISKSSPLAAGDAFKRVKNLLENDADLRKLDPKLQCQFNEKDMSGKAEGSQFTANMRIQSTAQGSEIEISVDLPFHLALVKGMVQKTLEKKLAESLA